MKKFTFKGVLDGIRSAKERPEDGAPGGKAPAGGPGRPEPGIAAEIQENLKPEHFRVLKVKRIVYLLTRLDNMFFFFKIPDILPRLPVPTHITRLRPCTETSRYRYQIRMYSNVSVFLSYNRVHAYWNVHLYRCLHI